ncbi:cupin domain-containing protein [Zooshikella sp. RANM57]|uniref:cupin domain-containing protein n=1 Tax=Zooshikella sp. RANM57 TaxID=3425863 RepID=UPI003D6ED212
MKILVLQIFSLLLLSTTLSAEVRVDTLSKTRTSWDGTPLPAYPAGQPEVTVLKYTIPPNTQLPLHRHPVINAAYVLSGELTVIKSEGNQTKHLKAGETLVELVNQWHYGKNETEQPTELIVFYAGIKEEPLTVLQE